MDGGKDQDNLQFPLNNTGFLKVIKLLVLSILLGIAIQNIYLWTGLNSGLNLKGVLSIIVMVGLFIVLWGKELIRIIATPYFAVTSLLFIAVGTAFGTFISQNAPQDTFVQIYGQNLSKTLTFLGLNDVFHSSWYVILFVLLAVSLVKISLSRKLNRINLGFHLAHLGPVIILLGFWWDYFAGYRGLIQLLKGKESSFAWVYHPNTNRIQDSIKLDFSLRLDEFESEKFEPDHRIQVWKTKTPNPNPQEPLISSKSKILTTLPLNIEKTWKIYNSDIHFTLKEFYPNFYYEYSYPADKDSVEPKDPGILIEIITPHGSDVMHLQTSGRYQIEDPFLQTVFEFYWNLPEEIQNRLANENINTNWASKNRIIFDGSNKMVHELTLGQVSSNPLTLGQSSPIPSKNKSLYSIIHLYPDAEFLIVGPATRNEKQENPVARIEVTRDAWPEKRDAFIFPHKGEGSGQFLIPGTNYVLALESLKDRETKYWRSDLTILSNQGIVEKQKSIKVNEPMFYKGYRFYQTDYDPNNPNYSGIGVSYTPGLYVIYFGFFVLVIGVFILFYLRSKPIY